MTDDDDTTRSAPVVAIELRDAVSEVRSMVHALDLAASGLLCPSSGNLRQLAA